MPPLDELVKLASLGTSGICIFGIFWTGWLLKASTTIENHHYHESLHKYMSMVIAIALIAGTSGAANAYIKQSEITNLENKNVKLASTNAKLLTEQQVHFAKAEDARKALNLILKSKEAYQLRNPNDELKTHLSQLEGYLNLDKKRELY